MKLIVAGATGFIGREVIYAALQNPAVSSVVGLSRRAVSDPRISKHEKWESILIDDFGDFQPDAMARMQGAVGCIWSANNSYRDALVCFSAHHSAGPLEVYVPSFPATRISATRTWYFQ
jgi:uncharacterized protein YbjT (DUF2867 family)